LAEHHLRRRGVHRSRDALLVRQIRDERQSLGALRVRRGPRYRPWGCVLDAWDGVRPEIGREPKGRCRECAADSCPERQQDGDRRWAFRAAVQRLEPGCPCLVRLAAEWAPCTRGEARSAASPCGEQEVLAGPEPLSVRLQSQLPRTQPRWLKPGHPAARELPERRRELPRRLRRVLLPLEPQ